MIKLIRLMPLVAMLITACSITSQKKPEKKSDLLRWRKCLLQQHKRHLDEYQTRGIFAYLSGQKKVYASFFWQQSGPNDYYLLLLNQLGKTELELKARPSWVQITDNKGQHYIGNNAEDMLYKLTGMLIPLNSLRQWILGLPGNATQYRLDDNCRLSELHYRQNKKNWKVVYGGYYSKNAPVLPSSMELIQDNQHIKLKMDNWLVK